MLKKWKLMMLMTLVAAAAFLPAATVSAGDVAEHYYEVSTAEQLYNVAGVGGEARTIHVTAPISLDRTISLDGASGNVTITGEQITRAPGFTDNMFDLGSTYTGPYGYYNKYTNAILTLKDITIDGNAAANPDATGNIINTYQSGTIILKNAILKNNSGTVIDSQEGGYYNFSMTGGRITGNKGGYVIKTGTGLSNGVDYKFVLKDAEISDNTGYVSFSDGVDATGCTFINNETISLISTGNSKFSDCTISGNTKRGISVYNSSAVTFTGCTISNNGQDGIECDYSSSSITLNNTKISGNKGYAVTTYGPLNISGSTMITSDNDIHLPRSYDNTVNGYINVAGKLTNTGIVAYIDPGSLSAAKAGQYEYIRIPDRSFANISQFSTGSSSYVFCLGDDNWGRIIGLTEVKGQKATAERDGNLTYYIGSNNKYYADSKAEREISLDSTVVPRPAKITLSKTEYTWDGKVKSPTVSVISSMATKISAANYSVTYSAGRKNVGKYSCKITFKGNYSGTKTLTFTINPKNTTLYTPSAQKKGFTVKWKAQTAKMSASRITGYQIRYAANSKMTSAKTKTISGYKVTSAKITKLSAKKKYYVQIRTYKKVNNVKYYSGWSKAKTVKTR